MPVAERPGIRSGTSGGTRAAAGSPAALARRALAELRAHAHGASDHPASGGHGTRLERLGVRLPDIERSARTLAREAKAWPPRDVVRLAHALADSGVFEARLVAYELLLLHRPAAAVLTAIDLEALGRGNDNWAATDAFSCYVAGPAWREGRVSDARVQRWARSRDRWWRRTALASTVALNVRARGGRGDVKRTLATCALLAADPDDMVVKALSWALRCVVPYDAAAVRRFLATHEAVLASRVRREVANKLATGLKHPRGARA